MKAIEPPPAATHTAEVSYYIDISPKYSLNIPKTAVLSIRGLGPGA
jgi:hypothetical protein